MIGFGARSAHGAPDVAGGAKSSSPARKHAFERCFRAIGSYAAAALLTLVAVAISLIEQRWTQGHLAYLWFLPAVLVSSLYCGFGAGFAAALGGGLAGLLIETRGLALLQHRLSMVLEFVFYMGAALIVAAIADLQRRTAMDVAASEAAARQQEDLAQAGARRLQLMLESIGDGVVEVDAHGVVTYLNPAAERLTGWTSSAALGKPFAVICPLEPDPRTGGLDNLADEVLQKHEPQFSSGRKLLAASEIRWVDCSAWPMESDTASAPGCLTVLRDVSHERDAAASHARLRAMADATDDAILALAPDGVITAWNRGAEILFGYSAAQVLGQSVDLLIPESHRIEAERMRSTVADGGRIHQHETVRITRAGDRLDVWASLYPIVEIDGSVSGISVIERNVTAWKSAQAELKTMNATLESRVHERTLALENANRDLEIYADSISHDLRAPLRRTGAFAQLLRDDFGAHLPPEGQRYVDRIMVNSAEMMQMVDGLLEISRTTRHEMERQEVDLASLATSIVEAIRSANPDRVIEWAIEPEMKVWADRRLMTLVMENLLQNAAKFSRGRNPATIAVGTQRDDSGEIRYFVRDNGAGFNPKYSGKLFSAFQRLHLPSEFEGTGIGLATARRIIDRHGGRIWAESQPDCGATFSFTLGSGTD
ncbi:MAG: PAS domain S-box protein [Armatimonadetes bacterium]|nr:PAS domain S-box protein [Armatimonadota bacterium]MDE2205017.1 PAS domain S-box protein [Armatimonadota bacterium]